MHRPFSFVQSEGVFSFAGSHVIFRGMSVSCVNDMRLVQPGFVQSLFYLGNNVHSVLVSQRAGGKIILHVDYDEVFHVFNIAIFGRKGKDGGND